MSPLRAVSWLALAPGSANLAEPTGGTSVFAPLSSHAEEIHRYSLFVLGITGAIFLVVFTLLAVAVVRFRRRPGDDDAEPPQVYGSDRSRSRGRSSRSSSSSSSG